MVYRVMKEMEIINRDDLFVWNARETRGHRKKFMKTRCLKDMNKHRFLHRCADDCNDLNKIVKAKCIHESKIRLDKQI